MEPRDQTPTWRGGRERGGKRQSERPWMTRRGRVRKARKGAQANTHCENGDRRARPWASWRILRCVVFGRVFFFFFPAFRFVRTVGILLVSARAVFKVAVVLPTVSAFGRGRGRRPHQERRWRGEHDLWIFEIWWRRGRWRGAGHLEGACWLEHAAGAVVAFVADARARGRVKGAVRGTRYGAGFGGCGDVFDGHAIAPFCRGQIRFRRVLQKLCQDRRRRDC